MARELTRKQRDVLKRNSFKPGNPGRPKGSRHKLGEHFIAALADDFEEHGADAIRRVREKDPAAYMRVCASLLPKEVKMDRNSPFDDWSDGELSRALDFVRAAIAEHEPEDLDTDPEPTALGSEARH